MLSLHLAERSQADRIFFEGAMSGKNTSDAKYGEKLVRMFAELLFSRRSRSMTELAELLGCHKSSVSRLADDIERYFGAELKREKRKRQLFYSIDRKERMNVPPLSESELVVLEMCQAFTRHLLGRKQFEEAARALQKSHGFAACDEPVSSGREFACVSPGSIDYTRHQEVLQNLITAISRQRVCKATYQSVGAAKPRTYYICPLKLFSHKDTVYVHAMRTNEQGLPTKSDVFYPLLAVHRFRKVVVLDATYDVPENYDFERFFNETFGVIKQEAFRVKVRLWGWAAQYVGERIWSRDQMITEQDDGSILLEFDASSEPEVLSWVLSFGDEAEVLGPDSLKEQMMAKLVRLHRTYGGAR